MTLSTSGSVWAEGLDIVASSGGNVKYSSMKKGIYEFDWQLQTPDQGDYLNFSVEKGKVFVNYDGDASTGRWFEVAPGTNFAIAPGQQNLSKLLVKVEGRTTGTWSFSTYDSYNNYPYDDAPTNPRARFINAAPQPDQMVDYQDITLENGNPNDMNSLPGTVGKKDAADCYRFEVITPNTVNAKLDAFHSEANLELWKWVDGVNDELIQKSDMKGDHDIITGEVQSGQYYFKVTSASKTKETSYNLNVWGGTEHPPELEPDMGDREFSATNIGTVVKKSSSGAVTYQGGSLEENRWAKYDPKSEGGKHIDIIEYIGGDDVSDFAKFTIQTATKFEIKNENVLFAVLNSKADTRLASSESYSSNLTVDLQPGTYYLQYSHEGSIPELFTSRITMSGI